MNVRRAGHSRQILAMCRRGTNALVAVATMALWVSVFITVSATNQFALADTASGNSKTPVKIIAFGDSLVAGYGLPAGQGFPEQLEKALHARGQAVEIANAGVSGDTIEAGLARLDWALGEGADGVIVVLGGNDFLRGVDPARSAGALDQLLGALADRKIPTLVGGMRAPLNFDPAYRQAFDGMYPLLTEKHGAMLDPFFLEGVALMRAFNQDDGIHPNQEGVSAIVTRMLPLVEAFLEKARAEKADS